MCRFPIVALLAALALLASDLRGEIEPPPPPPPPEQPASAPPPSTPSEPVAAEPSAAPLAPAASPEEVPEAKPRASAIALCLSTAKPDEAWVDRIHRQLFEAVCSSAAWFDGFFGDRRYDEEVRRASGIASFDARWSDTEGWEYRPRLRARFPLPNLDNRFEAFLGRDEDREILAERNDDQVVNSAFVRDRDDESLFAGLGYSPVRSARRSLTFGVGAKIRTDPAAFANGRFRAVAFVGDRHLVRFRQTGFWSTDEGWGTTAALDAERLLSSRFLLRGTLYGKFTEETVGAFWESRLSLFQGISGGRAIAYEAAMRGESDSPVSVKEYALTATYRQRILRRWLYAELVAGWAWPKASIAERRDTTPILGFGVELQFGGER